MAGSNSERIIREEFDRNRIDTELGKHTEERRGPTQFILSRDIFGQQRDYYIGTRMYEGRVTP